MLLVINFSVVVDTAALRLYFRFPKIKPLISMQTVIIGKYMIFFQLFMFNVHIMCHV